MEGFAVLRAASWPAFLRSRCAPFRTRSTSRTEPAGTSTMLSPRSTPPCRGCSLSSTDEARLAASSRARARRRRSVAGLTAYFSTENVPRCLVSGVKTWQPPTDGRTHRYEVVILDRSACFFDMDQQQRLVGALPLSQAQLLSAAVPAASDPLSVSDSEHGVLFVTRRGLLGVRIDRPPTKRALYVTRFKGFTWNPRFGPDPPSHGLSLAPDRPELWVLDAPNSVVHIFDVSELPGRPPRAGRRSSLETNLRRREPVRSVRAVASARSCTVRTVASSTSATRAT